MSPAESKNTQELRAVLKAWPSPPLLSSHNDKVYISSTFPESDLSGACLSQRQHAAIHLCWLELPSAGQGGLMLCGQEGGPWAVTQGTAETASGCHSQFSFYEVFSMDTLVTQRNVFPGFPAVVCGLVTKFRPRGHKYKCLWWFPGSLKKGELPGALCLFHFSTSLHSGAWNSGVRAGVLTSISELEVKSFS